MQEQTTWDYHLTRGTYHNSIGTMQGLMCLLSLCTIMSAWEARKQNWAFERPKLTRERWPLHAVILSLFISTCRGIPYALGRIAMQCTFATLGLGRVVRADGSGLQK